MTTFALENDNKNKYNWKVELYILIYSQKKLLIATQL